MKLFNFSTWSAMVAALANWPLDWARGLLTRQRIAERRLTALAAQSTPAHVARLAGSLQSLQQSGLAAGFDLARSQYAAGVQAGLIERSLIASGAFERRLGLLERHLLGPWARSV